jgi:hypothetical protein
MLRRYCVLSLKRHLLYTGNWKDCLSCNKSGDVPKSRLAPIGSAGAIGGTTFDLKTEFGSGGFASIQVLLVQAPSGRPSTLTVALVCEQDEEESHDG